MSLKLYKCEIETSIYVLAESRKDAQKVADEKVLLNASEILDGCSSYAIELNGVKEIDSWFADSEPYISRADEKNEKNSKFLCLTCNEAMELIVADKKKEADMAHAESLQAKFPFHGEIVK